MSKAALAKQLHSKGVPVPPKATVKSLEHRVRYWMSGNGWLIRVAKPPSRKPNHPVAVIDTRDCVWIPDSRMARMIVESGLVFVLGRTAEPPNDVPVIDVPSDFDERWPEVNADGSDSDSDS